ncbi:MAG: hypothetical protein AAF682_16090 [Planctomycetota bacterium]
MAAGGFRLNGKDVVIVLALIAAGAYGAWVALEAGGGLGTSWTDGDRVFHDIGSDVRYAIWDDPEPVQGAVNSAETEGRAALSPDGRLLVFQAGERGLGADLYAADLIDGVAFDPRPIAALNTAFDEVAPAFSGDALYFATDRSGEEFGLDLWRAPYSEGRFGVPEPFGPGLNTAADETDPLPLPGSRDVLFASNRPRGMRTDFDLFLAAPAIGAGAEDGFDVLTLGELNSPHEEREPGVTADGRVLVFASDRDGSRGGFDLFRSLRGQVGWLPPSPLDGLNTGASERAPLLSQDGFSLTYSRAVLGPDEGSNAAGAAGADLFRARSRELFALPPRAISLLDLLVLFALLLLALLAFLAKRWRGMEILYKCFLVSCLVHMALLWYLNQVHPEGDPASFGGEDRLFRVRVERAGNVASGSNQERGGALQAERTLVEPEAAPGRLETETEVAAAAPASRSLDRQSHEEALPGRDGMEPTPEAPRNESVVQLADQDAPFERYQGDAPALALAAGPTQSAPLRTEGSSPDRAASKNTAATPAASTFQALARGERATDALPRPSEVVAQPAQRAEPGGAEVALELPEEAFERKSGEVAGFALPAVASVAAPTRDAEGPERATDVQPTAISASEGSDPLPRDVGPLASLAPPTLASGDLPPRRATSDPNPTPSRGEPDVVLRDLAPDELRPPVREVEAPPRFDATNSLAATTTRRAPVVATAEIQPERFRFEAQRDEPAAPQRRSFELASAPAPAADDVPRRMEHTPYRNRFGDEKERALELYGGGEETEAAVKSGLDYLASIQTEDGYWGSPDDFHEKYRHVLVGKSALALLAFLGAGHTQESETEHSDVVERSIAFLLAIQDERTGHFGNSSAYSHGIATYALAECYAITEDEELRPALERAVQRIRSQQITGGEGRNVGGWGYYYPDGSTYRNDRWPRVSVTAWQVMALESARLGGLEVPDEVFDRSRDFLAGAWDGRRGAFRYSHDPGRLNSVYPVLPASTPAAIFALSLLGVEADSEQLADAVRFVLERAPDSYRYTSDDDFVFRAQGNLYFWYYGTLAMFRTGGSAWDRWNAQMKETLLEGQERDGSWEAISIYSEYAGDDDEDRAYSTAMCVLTLEIYYRYFTPLLEVK